MFEDGDNNQDIVEGSDMDQDTIQGDGVEQDSRLIVLFVVSWTCGVLALKFHTDHKFITITFYIESCFHPQKKNNFMIELIMEKIETQFNLKS
jgi:hypothetical protein